MFEDTLEKWTEYISRHTRTWKQGDPRHSLDGEVRTRLAQLDLLLEFEQEALDKVAIDPAESQAIFEYMLASRAALESGAMGDEEYFAGIQARSRLREDFPGYMRAWEELTLFAEAFYFFAWRLRDVLRESGFPGMGGFEAAGVRDVRNHLLQHPRGDPLPMSLVVTDRGPVLKTTTIVVGGATGDSRPVAEHLDQGLWVNAEELHAALNRRLEADASNT